jgi:hypothetical protein
MHRDLNTAKLLRLVLYPQAAAFGGIMYGKGAYERGRRYSVQQVRSLIKRSSMERAAYERAS